MDKIDKLNRDYVNNAKSLSNLFKEVQDIRYGRAEAKFDEEDQEREHKRNDREVRYNTSYVVDHRFNIAGAIIGTLFIIVFFSIINSGSVYANLESNKVKTAITTFEANKKTLNVMNIISSNISEKTIKEILNKEIDVEFETEYVENAKLPRGEEHILQEGKLGVIEQTLINTYENNQLLEEKLINEMRKSDPVTQIVEIGTSDYLFEKQVYLGDTMYTTEDIYLYNEPNEETQPVCLIYQHINVRLLEESNDWVRIKVDNYEGFVKGNLLTSEALYPGIGEIARIKRIKLNVSINMRLNKKSGLTREDFIKVFSDNDNDVNGIFKENAEVFYEIEEKYGINGIFVAAIGIHESAWGTSNIARDKNNLFGYGSYDSDPYNASFHFESYRYGIETVARSLVKNYLNQPGTPIYDGEIANGAYYNGPNVEGVNVRYASDENWSNRVYQIMSYLYDKL